MRRVDSRDLRLIAMGAGSRLGVALIVVVLLWLGFYWATATPEGL